MLRGSGDGLVDHLLLAAAVQICPWLEFDGTAEGNEREAGEVRLREEWWGLLLEVVS
jgi:hypothetical protein